MIELEDFIANSSLAIVKGIKKGQQDPDIGGHIAPLIQGEKRNDVKNFHLKDDNSNQATVLQFEVSVGATSSADEGAGAKAKAKLYVIDLEVGGNKGHRTEASSTHKLKFSIPIKIPAHGS